MHARVQAHHTENGFTLRQRDFLTSMKYIDDVHRINIWLQLTHAYAYLHTPTPHARTHASTYALTYARTLTHPPIHTHARAHMHAHRLLFILQVFSFTLRSEAEVHLPQVASMHTSHLGPIALEEPPHDCINFNTPLSIILPRLYKEEAQDYPTSGPFLRPSWFFENAGREGDRRQVFRGLKAWASYKLHLGLQQTKEISNIHVVSARN